MENQKMSLLVFACVLFASGVSAQLPPAIAPGRTGPFPTASSPNCNYLLSAGTAGSCVITTVDVERKLTLLQDGISRQRLQYVAHNSNIQTQLSDLQTRDRQFALRMDGLRRDLMAVMSRTVSSPSVPSPGGTGGGTGGGSGGNFNQLQVAINNVDTRLTNLSLNYQRDAVSQSRTNAALQSQLTQVTRDNQQLKATTVSLAQQLQQMSAQIRALATAVQTNPAGTPRPPPTTTTTTTTTAKATQPPGPTTNPAVIASILRSISNLTAATNQNSAQINNLKNQTAQITQNSKDLISLTAELRAAKKILTNTTATASQALTFITQVYPQQVATVQNLQAFTSNLSVAQGQMNAKLNQLQTDVIVGFDKQKQAINKLASGLISTLRTTLPLQLRQQLTSLQQTVQSLLALPGSGGPPAPPVPTTTPLAPPPIGSG